MEKLISFLLILSAIILASISTAHASVEEGQKSPKYQKAQVRYSVQFVLEQVLLELKRPLRPELPLPDLKLSSETTVEQFQKDMEGQWGAPPMAITNAYSVKANRIYLMEDDNYYKRHGRCIEDSLAHEIAHYVQVQYSGYRIEDMDEFAEMQAVEIQTAFREKFCVKN